MPILVAPPAIVNLMFGPFFATLLGYETLVAVANLLGDTGYNLFSGLLYPGGRLSASQLFFGPF